MSLPFILDSPGGGTGLTGTGIARNTGACTELSGDVTTSGSNAVTIKTSVALAGSPTTTTQSAGDNSTKIATTAYADAVVASTGTPGIILPPIGMTGNGSNSVFGAANREQFIQFVMPVTMTVGHVTVSIGTGVAGALMGIAIYNADGSTRLVSANGFSVDTGHTGAQRIAFDSAATVTLYRGTTYWIGWTATTSTTLTLDQYLPSTATAASYNAGTIRMASSSTATSNGVTLTTVNNLSGAQQRIPIMVFD